MEKTKAFHQIIDELCLEKNIEQKKLSYGWIRELKKNNIVRNLMRYQFDLNTAISYNIANDKFATYEVLSSNNVPTIKHLMIFNSETRSAFFNKDYLDILVNFLKENNNKIVIKANDSCKGKDVFLCSSENEIKEIIIKLFNEKKDTLSACPFKQIQYEYRVIYLCGEILYVYKKRKPYVIGNGKDSIKELIDQKYNLDDIHLDLIKELDLDKIITNNECVEISWKHNLNGGAEAILVDDSDQYVQKVKEVAFKTGQAMNIKFASIDIAQTNDGDILVMEVNASVCMNKFTEIVPNGYNIAKEIYSKAIDKMFE